MSEVFYHPHTVSTVTVWRCTMDPMNIEVTLNGTTTTVGEVAKHKDRVWAVAVIEAMVAAWPKKAPKPAPKPKQSKSSGTGFFGSSTE